MTQFVLNLPIDDPYKLENFIISSSNKLAYDTLTDVSRALGVAPYKNTVLIYGPKSCGKTFLAKIFKHAHEAVLLNATDDYYHNRAYIIENIETWNEETLLHYFNLINENNKSLLLTSKAANPDFKIKDLSSRISSISKLELLPPDEELMRILLFKIFSERSIKLNPKVLEFLVNRLPREFDQIIKAAEKIITRSLSLNKRVSVEFVKEIMGY